MSPDVNLVYKRGHALRRNEIEFLNKLDKARSGSTRNRRIDREVVRIKSIEAWLAGG